MSQRENRRRKPKDNPADYLERSAKSFSDNVSRSAPFWMASYTLIGAILALGLIGYAIDKWRGTSPWFLISGLLLGIVVGFYDLAKAVFKR